MYRKHKTVNVFLFSYTDKLYLLVEFAPHGSLFGYLKEYRENPREHHELELHYMNRLKLARHIAKGMAFLAKKRVNNKVYFINEIVHFK